MSTNSTPSGSASIKRSGIHLNGDSAAAGSPAKIAKSDGCCPHCVDIRDDIAVLSVQLDQLREKVMPVPKFKPYDNTGILLLCDHTMVKVKAAMMSHQDQAFSKFSRAETIEEALQVKFEGNCTPKVVAICYGNFEAANCEVEEVLESYRKLVNKMNEVFNDSKIALVPLGPRKEKVLQKTVETINATLKFMAQSNGFLHYIDNDNSFSAEEAKKNNLWNFEENHPTNSGLRKICSQLYFLAYGIVQPEETAESSTESAPRPQRGQDSGKGRARGGRGGFRKFNR